MEIFGGEDLERKVMEKVGCLNYSSTPWESEGPDVFERQISYSFDKRISRYKGAVTSSQQKTRLSDRNCWLIEEVMTLHGVPIGEYFNVWTLSLSILSGLCSICDWRMKNLYFVSQLHLRYQVEESASQSKGSNVQVFFGIAWLKSTKNQKKMTKNILSNLQDRLKAMFVTIEKEFAST